MELQLAESFCTSAEKKNPTTVPTTTSCAERSAVFTGGTEANLRNKTTVNAAGLFL